MMEYVEEYEEMHDEARKGRKASKFYKKNGCKILHIRVDRADEEKLKMVAAELGMSESKAIRYLVKNCDKVLK